MPQSLSKIYLHAIFSTKDRRPAIGDEIRRELRAYLMSVLRNDGACPIDIAVLSDHVHLLFELPRDLRVSKLMQEAKASSSKWLKGKGPQYSKFQWQRGYSVFSLGQSGLQQALAYLESQDDRHRRRSFKEELLEFLRGYNVEYDEKYLWD